MSDLKPCPRCGGKSEIINEVKLGSKAFDVFCIKCGLQTWGYFESKEEAIEYWNRLVKGEK